MKCGQSQRPTQVSLCEEKNWKEPKFQPAGLKSQTWGSSETTQPTLSPINLLCSTFLTLTWTTWTLLSLILPKHPLKRSGDMINYRAQEMIISDLCLASDPPWAEGQGLTGLGRIKPSVYRTLKAVIPSKTRCAECSARGFGLFWTLTVSSSGAELAVNKKQPAEMRFMKSPAPQNVALTSLGSISTLFGERLGPQARNRRHWIVSLFVFTSCLKSEFGPEHAAPKIKMLSRGAYTPISDFEMLQQVGDTDYPEGWSTHTPKAARSKSFFTLILDIGFKSRWETCS